jgi:hypothetical protein
VGEKERERVENLREGLEDVEIVRRTSGTFSVLRKNIESCIRFYGKCNEVTADKPAG